MSEHLPLPFLYTMGQRVQYEGRHWRVRWRRYTEHDMLVTSIAYLLDLETGPSEHAQATWAQETDLADVPNLPAGEAP